MKLIKIIAMLMLACIVWYSCNDQKSRSVESQINLRWIKAYPDETREDVVRGLAWCLSFLGATLPQGAMENAMEWQSENVFTLNVSLLGFNPQATVALQKLFSVFKRSEEYDRCGGMDLGRFVMLTLNSSSHYYEITGAKKTYSAFRAQYTFADKKAAVLVSTVALGNRLIELSEADATEEIAFVALEGKGSVALNNFVVEEFEAMDIMPNGQLRFALYDADGKLKAAASPVLTEAGKPSKCLWCHEISLLPPFEDNHQLADFYSTREFKEEIDRRTNLLESYRKQLASDIDFTKRQEHTKAELLYLSFTEPSAERLAGEWNLPLPEVRKRLHGIATHKQHEFAYLGETLYWRKDVEELGPFKNLPLPDDARDFSQVEPDLFHR
jgi:hypothetical protein